MRKYGISRKTEGMNAFELHDLSIETAEEMAAQARLSGKWTLIGGLIVNDKGQLFTQRRGPSRKFGPGWWDNVGGHLEGEETLAAALAREVTEETGWKLRDISRVVAIRNWHDVRGESVEFIALANVDGDLNHPCLEADKVDAAMWVDQTNLDLMNANRNDTNDSQAQIYAHALKVLNVRHQP